jgi:hypothetical protein
MGFVNKAIAGSDSPSKGTTTPSVVATTPVKLGTASAKDVVRLSAAAQSTGAPVGTKQGRWQAFFGMAHHRLFLLENSDKIENSKWVVEAGIGELGDWIALKIHGAPKGPFPSVHDLKSKFPKAGLPDRIMGTNVDIGTLLQAGLTPDQAMAQAQAMGMNTVRVGAYWNQIQPKGPGDHDFSQLDAVLDAAKRHGLKVILTVGAKAPCYPEYHFPDWAKPAPGKDVSKDPLFRQRTLNFVKLVAQHEKDNRTICMWQVENEPYDPTGPSKLHMDEDMLAQEAQILRQSDGHRRPLMINMWAQGDHSRMGKAFKIADLVGLDTYGAIPMTLHGHTFNSPGKFERTVGFPDFALRMSKKYDKPIMIAELQADNWSSYKTNSTDIAQLTHQLEQEGYHDMLFWRLSQNVVSERQGDQSLNKTETQLTQDALKQNA